MSVPRLEPAGARFEVEREERELSARCRALADAASRAGAGEHEVFGERRQTVAVRFEKGDMKLTQVDEATSLGLRVFHEGRLGFSSTNQSDPAALRRVAQDALSLARINPPDPANRLPEPVAPDPPLDLLRSELCTLEIEPVVEAARRFARAVLAVDRRVSLDQAELRLARGTRALVNGRGVELCESDATIDLMALAMAIDGEEVGGFHYVSDHLRDPGLLDARIRELARELGGTVVENLGAAPGASYGGAVLFSPDAFLEVFLAPLASAAGAVAVQRGRSALAGRIGQTVAAPSLALHDDPTDITLAGATRFDREGQPARRRAILRDGVLESYLYNSYAAHVEGRASTGHASGGARALPGLDPHALSVAPGAGGTLDDMLRRLGSGLFLRRFSGSVDPASGDFSGVAKSSRWVEGGRLARPVRECLVSGNSFELLHRLVALSSALERVGGAALVPYALVEGVSVTAG